MSYNDNIICIICLFTAKCRWKLLLMSLRCLMGEVIVSANGISEDLLRRRHHKWASLTVSLCPHRLSGVFRNFGPKLVHLTVVLQQPPGIMIVKTKSCMLAMLFPWLCLPLQASLLQLLLPYFIIVTHNFLMSRNWREWRRYRPTCSWQQSFAQMQGGNYVLLQYIYWLTEKSTQTAHSKCICIVSAFLITIIASIQIFSVCWYGHIWEIIVLLLLK